MASGHPAAFRLLVRSGSGASLSLEQPRGQAVGGGQGGAEVTETISVLPPHPSCLWPHAPRRNDDMTSLQPCHLSPRDSLKRTLSPEHNGIPEATGARKSQTELSERKISCLCQANADSAKEGGGGTMPPSSAVLGMCGRCHGFNMFSPRKRVPAGPSPPLPLSAGSGTCRSEAPRRDRRGSYRCHNPQKPGCLAWDPSFLTPDLILPF